MGWSSSNEGKNEVERYDREQSDRELLQQLRKDMYFGNGLPGMTSRMLTVERCLNDLEREMEKMKIDIKEQMEKSDKKIDRLTWLVAVGVGILATLEFVLKLSH